MSKSAKGRDMSKLITAAARKRRGSKLSPTTRRKMSISQSRVHSNLSYRQKLSQSIKKKYDTDAAFYQGKLKHLANLRQKPRDTKIERLIREVLEQLKVNFDSGKTFQVDRIVAQPDFFLPEYNIAIECDGEYWHSSPHAKRRDHIKDQLYRTLGLQVVRLSEKDILSNPIRAFEKGLKDVS